ncbi:class I SAM-dependent methyltransferase [Niveibacterium sp.]|uniref:class I SAM-dependent methyltransferase n=1 Tax=Niveibacterium sp. TaxID=2017444 RepID=UPI0035B41CB0
MLDHLLTPESRILDFGAGDGDLVLAMCERGLSAAAYEPSVERISTLRERLSGRAGFLGVWGPEDEGKFDVVTMTEVIEHVLDESMDLCLQRVASLVRPDGLLVVTTPNTEDLELNMVFCPITGKYFHRWQHVRSFTLRALSELLAHYGFEEVVMHRLPVLESLFVPYDRLWGEDVSREDLPAYLLQIRRNEVARVEPQSSIIYVGRRR